jgi:hypothetical protein
LIKGFLNNNHLQGYIPSKINIGLFFNDELVSVMTFGKSRKFIGNNENCIELLRFCNIKYTSVIGSANKIFKYFIKNFNYEKIISYAKRDWTNKFSNIYEKLGFNFLKYTDINYYWCFGTKKYHRYTFNKIKLIKDGYDPNKTEVQIMYERKYYRIYDTGNLKFVYNK